MKIWLVQMQPDLNNKEGNVRKMLGYINRAIEAKADLIAFPEMALTGYMCHEKYRELSEPIPGPSTTPIMKRAKEGNLYVVLGMPELKNGFMFNSAPLFGPEGIVGIWRKHFLATAATPLAVYDDGMFFVPGSSLATFDTRFGKLGIIICKDAAYPELTRLHAYRGARLLLCISATPGPQMFHTWGKSRALENIAFFAYANRVGTEEKVTFTGGSYVANPSGDIVKAASMGADAKEEVLECEIDLEAALKQRLASSLLLGVRPEIMAKVAVNLTLDESPITQPGGE